MLLRLTKPVVELAMNRSNLFFEAVLLVVGVVGVLGLLVGIVPRVATTSVHVQF